MKFHVLKVNFLNPQGIQTTRHTSFFSRVYLSHLSLVDLSLYHALVFLTIGKALFYYAFAGFENGMKGYAYFKKGVIGCIDSCLFISEVFVTLTVRVPALFLHAVWRTIASQGSDFFRDFFSPRIYDLREKLNIELYPHSVLPRAQFLPVAAFGMLLAIVAAPFMVFGSLDAMQQTRQESAMHIKNGMGQFFAGTHALYEQNTVSANQQFQKSLASFKNAENSFHNLGQEMLFFSRLIPFIGKKVQDAESLIFAGKELSLIGSHSTALFSMLSADDAFSAENFVSSLDMLQELITEESSRFERAYHRIELIERGSIPSEFQNRFDAIKKSLETIRSAVRAATPFLEQLSTILGSHKDQKYLVIMQNNSEIRATGGFMGSFATLDVSRGKIKKIEIPGGGTYDLQGTLREWVVSPWQLHLINPRWEFQDANWFADFPASARKMIWFYEKGAGSTVDGVIAINASIAPHILGLTGPIEIPSFQKKITKENFFEVTERAVELEYDRKQNKPKKFIGELVEAVANRLSSTWQAQGQEIAYLLLDALVSRDIQLYSKDTVVQQALQSSGLSGEIVDHQGDFLMIVDTNIGGRKTDRVITADVAYRVHDTAEDTQEAMLSLTRVHGGKKGDYFTGVKNINYVRIYVPKGSTLISAKGFSPPPRTEFENPPVDARLDSDLSDIQGSFTLDEKTGMIVNHEFNKTVFGNWIQTNPGETSVVELTYRLPSNLPLLAKNSYSLLIQRQSGSSIKKIDFSYGMFSKTIDPFIHNEYVSSKE